jgi:hypothetical protein
MPNNPTVLSVAEVEAAVRNERLKRELEARYPAPPTHDHGPGCWMCGYDEHCRLMRAQRGQS